MKLLTLAAILFYTYSHYAQKTYHFDYVIEYERTFYKEDSITQQLFYLTNSKDNSYFLKIRLTDSLNYQLDFIHQDKILVHIDKALKKDINDAEIINLPCSVVNRSPNIYKSATKNYDYFRHKDTIIDQKFYARYELRSILDIKKRQRRQAGTNYFIIDKATSFHLPILTHPTEYEEWKQKKQLPNGIFYVRKHINVMEEDHTSDRLIAYYKTDKKIVIPSECDYSK